MRSPSRLLHPPEPVRRARTAVLPAIVALLACSSSAAPSAEPQAAPSFDVEAHYTKSEHRIEMRDGVRLHTSVYAPRDAEGELPILMTRTPYACAPYGRSAYPERLASRPLMEEGYIFVCQDVRGRWMSEGRFDNMRPHVPGETPIDESSDTWDTIEWLLDNVPDNSGKVGMWGISYPGFYTSAAMPESHPALVASSPQAPIADFWFDDFHHRGAFTLSYFLATPVFGYQKEGPTDASWYEIPSVHTPDAYQFYKDLGPLSNADRYYGEDNFFWQQLVEHPNYDEFWQRRNILQHLDDVDHAVMTVGGWFDAEDLYGPLMTYRTIEERNPEAFNILVMGPWSHGDWARHREHQVVGDVCFGHGLSEWYQREVEAPFFRYFLKGEGERPDFEALVYDTGGREWNRFADWPPSEARATRYFLRDGEVLTTAAPGDGDAPFTEYVSDPNEAVPHMDRTKHRFTPRPYMAEDQRFAERRPDVIEFMTPELEEDVVLSGDIVAHLEVSTTGTDSDWVVKLVDVYPPDTPNQEVTPEHVDLGDYQQMVRSEIMRGRFRNSFEHPEPFEPGAVTTVEFPLQDVYHTFREGHQIMIQIQSTWFPLFDLNPQTFVPNIFEATEEDFRAATQRVYHSPGQESYLEVKVLESGGR